QALLRDDLKCLLTGMYDEGELLKAPAKAKAIKEADPNAEAVATNCAHILSCMSLTLSITASSMISSRAGSPALQMIQRYGGLSEEVMDSLNGNGIHQLGNVLTISIAAHDSFDSLRLWLEKIDVCAPLKVKIPRLEMPKSQYLSPVTFKSAVRDGTLPNPKFISVHAAVCRVAHMSGAADYIKFVQDKNAEEVHPVHMLPSDFSAALDRRFQLIPAF
ncbi:hypothetical protein DFH07DRAFT_737067, partial [Mycena maculata]